MFGYPHVLCILITLRSYFAKLHAKDLRNFLSVGPNGSNFIIVNKLKSYKNIVDGSVTSYMEKNPDSINLEWYHHMKCWKRFCDEGKSADNRERRKKVKELALKAELLPKYDLWK